MTVHDIFARVSPVFRRRRLVEFIKLYRPTAELRILDVGGYPQFWAGSGIESQITILNIHEVAVPEEMRANCRAVLGDGTALDYADGEFDITFSNSVIEHLATPEQQKRFASEIRRVGKRFYVQTPAYEFFMEPHYITPLVHWLPVRVRRKILRNFTVWGWLTRPSREQVESFIREIRLLRYAEMEQLFPNSTIIRERFVGMTKSYVAMSP